MSQASTPEYPDQLVARLCGYLDVDANLVGEVQSALNRFGQTWWNSSNRRVKRTDRNRELLALSCAAEQMQKAIDELSPELWEALKHFGEVLGIDSFSDDVEDEYGNVEYPRQVNSWPFSKDTLAAQIAAIQDAAKVTVGLEPTTRGPEADSALVEWLKSVQRMFHIGIKIEFKRDEEKGEPISPAARFCVDAFQHISPDTKNTTVLNAMKKIIAEQNK